MKIGELATRTRTPVETVRYYERAGLLPPAPRSESNYRIYGAHHVERLGFVRNCRSLDMSLDEIRVLLRFRDAPDADCGDVDALVDRHIGHVTSRIRALRQLEMQLRALRASCVGSRNAAQCGILDGLAALGDGGDASRTPAMRAGATSGSHLHPAGAHPRAGGIRSRD
ncbi:MAG: Cd(II)/Pb(II)-responsive transcriptional regulator [Rubrivivax sp.]